MKVTETKIPGVLIIEPVEYHDERGFFLESFNKAAFAAATGVTLDFVQDNHSRSNYGVVRGLHYQIEQPQGKLIQVIRGTIFDVAVDIRKESPTYGEWVGVGLSGETHRQLWVPPGLAHGFLALSNTVDVIYKTTDYYAPKHERTLLWNDEDISIDWPDIPAFGNSYILSDKDTQGLPLAHL